MPDGWLSPASFPSLPLKAPSYLVTSLCAGMQATENIQLNLALENLTDQDYRIHGSGQNAPGLNATFGVKIEW
ncbi:MAG: hypothetical protein ACSHYF_09065 [Verrucomicrobiaceae bacterium]